MKNIAVLVSGGGTNLQALIDAERSGVITSGKITLVLSNKEGAYALTRAQNAGIKAHAVVEKDPDLLCKKLLAELEKAKIDVVVLAGFLAILTPEFVSAYERRIINIHPALLPKYGGKGYYGLHVHRAVLAAGETVSGATVHFVTAGVDQGEIIAQKEVAVLEGDTPESLQQRIMEEAEWILLPRATEELCQSL
ncbi:MAG: phosphoribosylglycinamide formyltransferase [Clostridia bacterium]|nr:phosphoribosylglycinamide formyltransferase [Clostridia bacterium]